MKNGRTISSLTLLFVLFWGCKNDYRLTVDTKSIDLNINYTNVDSLFQSVENIKQQHELHSKFLAKLGELYRFEVTMNTQQVEDSLIASTIINFYADPYIQQLEKEKQNLHTELWKQNNELNKGFKHFNYHFPTEHLPRHIFFINKLFSGIKSADSVISVGLESYISNNSTVIQQIPNDQLYQWQKEAMHIKYLARDITLSWIQAHLFVEMDETLAQHIIQAGKLLFVLQACFPEKDGAYILRYKPEQFEWAESHEKLFWDYLVKDELLFKNNIRDKTNFLNEGPYTVGLPDNGPDRLGQFLGWKIVKQYFKANKNLSLQELVATNYNTILQSYELD